MRRNHLKANLAQMKANRERMGKIQDIRRDMQLAGHVGDPDNPWIERAIQLRLRETAGEKFIRDRAAIKSNTPVKPSLWERLKGMMK